MNEDLLRALVKDAVRQRLAELGAGGLAPPAASRSSSFTARGAPLAHAPALEDSPSSRGPRAVLHISHGRYQLIKVADECLIEPSVRCNHCGYCESHGH